MNFVQKTYKNLINIIYPLTCAGCKCFISPPSEHWLCITCQKNIVSNIAPFCRTCGKSIPVSISMVSHIHQCRDCQESRHYYEQVWSACIYEGVIRHCIHEFKYKGNLKLIKTLVNIMIDFANIHIPVQDFDIISSVPIHPRKMHLREFNQSAILSHRLSLRFKIPLNNNLLKRTRNTLPQNQLSRRQREKNIAGAFILQDKKTLNKKILLIDDIYTTGITANECAKTLKTGGAKTVSVFTLARGY